MSRSTRIANTEGAERVATTAVREAPRRNKIATFPSILTTNPYQRLLYEALGRHGYAVEPEARFELGWLVRARREVGFLHFHWPQPFWRHEKGPRALRLPLSLAKLGLFALRLAAARLLGYRVVWTIHQILPHEVGNERLDRLGAGTLASLGNVLVTHDEGTREAAGKAVGPAARRIEVIPHGSYVGVYPPGRARDAVREEMGLRPDAFVFLCFGDLRAYKEVERLLEAFGRTALPHASLVVAGTVRSPEHGAAVRVHAARDRRIRTLLEYVPDERVAELYGACDAAVVARTDGGTSGSLILALSMGLPVVAARTPVYRELLGYGEAGWLFDPEDTDSLRQALEAAATASRRQVEAKARAALARADSLRWPEIAARTAELLEGRT
ncbi:MAG TPA: glycosyltransferase family 4 protein [Gaiellaceae bacterium]|nr:glycosyltransferase family 4 protein [Gaiellaceae bacterium]